MSEELDVLKLVCQRLENSNISYMLTGSLASNFYAVPRMTRDIDIVIELLNIEVPRFYGVFHDEFYIDKAMILEAIKHQDMFNIIHNTTVLKIDFVIRKESPYRHIEFQRKKSVDLDGIKIWIVSPEDLIISKLVWVKDAESDYQLRDVKNLLASTKNLDMEYIEKWVHKLELNSAYEKAKLNG